jgi:peptide/nickel transport system permease protein
MALRTIVFYLALLGSLGFAFLAFFGASLAPYSPHAHNLLRAFAAPSSAHWFGTADNGVDIFSFMLYGAQRSGFVAFFSVGISLGVGAVLGMIAALKEGAIETIIRTLADWVQSFPALILNVAMLSIVRKPSAWHVIAALSFHGWPMFARLAYAQVLSLRSSLFIEAARALALPPWRIGLFHFVPNLAAPLLVQAAAGLGHAVVAESTLSFFGVGGSETPSWGTLLDQGLGVMLVYPHLMLISAGAIAFVALCFNLVGDELRLRWLEVWN